MNKTRNGFKEKKLNKNSIFPIRALLLPRRLGNLFSNESLRRGLSVSDAVFSAEISAHSCEHLYITCVAEDDGKIP